MYFCQLSSGFHVLTLGLWLNLSAGIDQLFFCMGPPLHIFGTAEIGIEAEEIESKSKRNNPFQDCCTFDFSKPGQSQVKHLPPTSSAPERRLNKQPVNTIARIINVPAMIALRR